MKTCRKCGVSKEESSFSRVKGYLRGICKPCRAAENSVWYAKNTERAKANVQAWQSQNPEKVKAYKKGWFDKNPAARRALVRGRQAQQLNATPKWADAAKIKEFYVAADFLGMVTGEWYSVDHIVPLQSKLVCGLHCEQNLQVLPASDNLRKSNRRWPDMP